MQIVHHSTDATQRTEGERLAQMKGNDEKENSHPREIEAGQGSSRAVVARARWFQRRARRWLLGAERRGTSAEERREERESAVACLDRERGVNASSGGPTT
jgi:hypothetical protein